MPAARVLCLGDLHLGVRPSRLPSAVDPREHATAAAWRRAVDLALDRDRDEGVGLVLLSGDVVDRANRYFEAFGPLEEGIRRLAEAGVEVCAVAGNHDFDVLPRLSGVAGGDRFHLLGQGGHWERYTWQSDDGRPLLHVDGWSFPSRDVTDDPLESYDFEAPDDGAPVIGLVHGDLGQAASTNAPLSRAALDRPGPAAWVLGHIHKPELFDLPGGRWALYPGSPQPLARSETGIHGAWIFDLEGGRPGRPERAPLATMRHEPVEVDLTGAEGVEDVRDLVTRAARRAAEDVLAGGQEGEAGDLRLLLPRPRLTGRTAAHRELPELARGLAEEPLDFTAHGVRVVVADLLLATRPAVDLGLLSGDDPPGLLADLLRGLESGGDPGDPELLERADRRVEEVRRHRPYLPLTDRAEEGDGEAEDAEPERTPRDRLRAAAGTLLDALLAQKPDLEERLGGGGGEPPEGSSQ